MQSADNLAVEVGSAVLDNAACATAGLCRLADKVDIAAGAEAKGENAHFIIADTCLVNDRLSVAHLTISEDKDTALCGQACALPVLSLSQGCDDISAAVVRGHLLYVSESFTFVVLVVRDGFVIFIAFIDSHIGKTRAKADHAKEAPLGQRPNEQSKCFFS